MKNQLNLDLQVEIQPVKRLYKPNEIWAEEKYPELDFILIPIAVVTAYFHEKKLPRVTASKEKELLLRAFGLEKSSRHLLKQIYEYISFESSCIKQDSTKSLSTKNRISPEEYKELIVSGMRLLSKMPITETAQMRKLLPSAPLSLHFSRIARFVLNGKHDRFWYHDNAVHVEKLFKEFPKKLIFDLLAATSIRSSLKSNIKKMKRALFQYYRKEKGIVKIGKTGEKIPMASHFSGFLDAQLFQLETIMQGKPLGEGDPQRARKIRNFSEAMQGVISAVVVDIWLMRAFNADVQYAYKDEMASRSPTPRLYDAIEWYVRTIAQHVWFQGREISSMIWSGIRRESNTGGTRYEEALTSELSHGLFENLYHDLAPHQSGVGFKLKEDSQIPA